jgi:DNA-directed RNA polymerase subunit M/transcription elongation factor TFIIS
MQLHKLVTQRNRLRNLQSKLRDALRELEYELEDNSKVLKELQNNCVHVQEWYGEGRHGSDKGTKYYRCKICDFHWED